LEPMAVIFPLRHDPAEKRGLPRGVSTGVSSVTSLQWAHCPEFHFGRRSSSSARCLNFQKGSGSIQVAVERPCVQEQGRP
jgi:hypothetical protein